MSSFEPQQLNALAEAFDIAWKRIAPKISNRSADMEFARLVLADVILSLTRHGNFDPQWLADHAVRIVLPRACGPRRTS